MKKVLIATLLTAGLTACEKMEFLPTPSSEFSVSEFIEGEVTLKPPSGSYKELTIDWGDGEKKTYSTRENLYTHVYDTDGGYKVTVTTKNGINRTASDFKNITISSTQARMMIYPVKDFKDNSLNYFIDNRLVATSGNKYYSGTASLDCSDESIIKITGISIIVKPGVHKLRVESFPKGSSRWEESFIAKNKNCLVRSLR